MVDKLSEISGCLRLAYEVCKVMQTVKCTVRRENVTTCTLRGIQPVKPNWQVSRSV